LRTKSGLARVGQVKLLKCKASRAPGWIETRDYSGLRRKDHKQHPAGRVGRPEDVAEIVSWLLDGKRSGFVTGANFVIDGGMTRKMIYEE
jgi:NAD(P)-dependent dehydrogenase (short-subunit alcohol dehydrogenase family)